MGRSKFICPFLGALLMTLAGGCSFVGVDTRECRVDTECSSAFGFGYRCDDDGFCQEHQAQRRCQNSYPEDLFSNPTLYSNTIVFGNLMDQSLATHRARENAAQLAIKQATTTSQLNGQGLGIVFCSIAEDSEFDDFDRASAATAMATYLIDELNVPAIIGPAASDDVLQVFQDLADRGTVFVSPSASSPALSSLDPAVVTDESPGLLWRTTPPDSLQGEAIAFDMRTLGRGRTTIVERAVVVYDDGIYGSSLSEVFSEHFQQLGGEVTLLPYSNAAQLSDRVTDASMSNAEEVLFISSQTGDVVLFFANAASLSGFDSKTVFLTDAAANPDVLEDSSSARFAAVRGSRPAPRSTDDLVFAGFLAAYSGDYGEDASQFSFTANAYDAAWILAAGAAWAVFNEESVTGVGVARGLRQLSEGAQVDARATSWPQMIEHFRRGESFNLAGASGDLDFDPETEETSGRVEFWTIDKTNIVPIASWPPVQELP